MKRKTIILKILMFVAACLIPKIVQGEGNVSEVRRYEVAPCLTVIGLKQFEITNRKWELGFGGRFGFLFNENWSVEAEASFFPKDEDLSQKKYLFLFGPKIRVLNNIEKQISIMAKVRPGFLHISSDVFCPIGECQPPPSPTKGRTEFAIDLGAVIQIYSSSPLMVRLDVGDTIINFSKVSYTSHNPHFIASVGFRF